ncbi:cytoskeleton-associated protein 2-like isoform X1 [Ornithorhynchus anatinus]|uniref:cytoskeleton-associated protein 2-like isoform X1 n=1 Tax=Ornithorhynchus anatinus TaxID=9258 RepID=UPI0010A8CD52|nr:cytoskeleton-associated protein 2-like isoform X1 [Ornithorhynchus anatinus]
MVGTGGALGAEEERRKKLQEYLAAKGKLKCQNPKPYLRDQNNRLNLPPSKSTTRPEKDAAQRSLSNVVLPCPVPKARGPLPQSKPSNVPPSQRAPPPFLGKGPTARCRPSKPGPKQLAGNTAPSQLGVRTKDPAAGKQPGRPGPPPGTREVRRSVQPKRVSRGRAEPRNAKPAPRREDRPRAHSPKGSGKENPPSSVAERKQEPDSRACLQPKASASHAGRSGLGLKQALVRDWKTSRILRDQSNRRSVSRPQALASSGKPRRPANVGSERPGSGVSRSATVTGQKKNPSDGRPGPPCERKSTARGNLCNADVEKVTRILGAKSRRSVSRAGVTPAAQVPYVSLTTSTAKREGWPNPASPEATGPPLNPTTGTKGAENDRRRKLEEWKQSKGKTYKRPPMGFPAKKRTLENLNHSFWKKMEEEEEEKRAQLELVEKINNVLGECLKLIEGGSQTQELLAILSGIPEAEKFAKFWVCKAKLLARQGPFDVIGLYEAAVQSGAVPIQELQEVIFDILKNTNRETEDAGPPARSETAAETTSQEPRLLPTREGPPVLATPQTVPRCRVNNPMSSIKLHVTPIPRRMTERAAPTHDLKLLTPVRRSLRIEQALFRYPEMLKDHDTVVASLDELAEVDDVDLLIYRKNEALPEDVGLNVFGL